ncbi:hypothetical protein E4U42_002559 [Claviceps africana]|uniref:Uncharacterized protein n=1 Tax=Claviceps africana TaxID=83212 RepID=A0A8K0NJG8_9HYPO|nr:hypothetical protein E4U42_002559 [Claviceps africana]
MQFSTSTVLAAIAIYAGQTLADCSLNPPPAPGKHITWVEVDDCKTAADKSQTCPSVGVSTSVTEDAFHITSGNTNILVDAYCGSPDNVANKAMTTFCLTNSNGDFTFDCDTASINLIVYKEFD